MIYSNRNLRRRLPIHFHPNGKLLIVKRQPKTLVPVEIVLTLQITVIHLQIVVAIGIRAFLSSTILIHIYSISSSSKTSTSYSSGNNDGDATKRFSNAKAISSDQFFNKDSDVCSK